MPQAILTNLVPATMRGPLRVKAHGSGNAPRSPGAPYVIVPYNTDDCEGGYWAHKRAAQAFAIKYKWSGNWHGQELRNGDWIFICDPKISFSVPRNV